MATPVSIAIRRADALARVAKATRTIATQTGADIADFPDAHKQEALRPAIEAEWLAGALEAIAEATKAAEPTPDAATAPPANDEDTTDYTSWNVLALSQFAETIGVEKVGSLRSKQALIDAIKARTSREKAD